MISDEDLFNESDDVIGDSDEENITCDELIKQISNIRQNEKLSPILLEPHSDMFDLLYSEISSQENLLNNNEKDLFINPIQRIQIERLKFIMTDYFRIRMQKLHDHGDYYLKESRSSLKPEEIEYAQSDQNLIRKFLMDRVVSKTHPGPDFNFDNFNDHPNLDSFVTCFIMEDIVVNVSENMNRDAEQVSLNLTAGDQVLLPFRCVEQYVKDGAVVLI